MNSFKAAIVQACSSQLEDKLRDLNDAMKALSEAATHDSKSTAGDKHETSRAMVQLEQERTGKQLKDAEEQLREFQRIDFQKSLPAVSVGSLLYSDKGCFLIALALGKLIVEDQTVFAISIQSPLGKALSGARQGDQVTFNGISYQVKEIA